MIPPNDRNGSSCRRHRGGEEVRTKVPEAPANGGKKKKVPKKGACILASPHLNQIWGGKREKERHLPLKEFANKSKRHKKENESSACQGKPI